MPDSLFTVKTDNGVVLFPESTKVIDPQLPDDPWFNDVMSGLPDAIKTQLSLVPAVSGRPQAATPSDDLGAPSPIDGDFFRPNGEQYFPRMVTAGSMLTQDIAVVRRCQEKSIPLLLLGPPGTGKTALLEAAMPNMVWITGTGDTETADFIGGYHQTPDGKYVWVDGPLLHAAENGLPFGVDELPLIDSRALAILYSLMDGRGEIRVTANPARGTVKVKEGFYVVAAGNPDVPGAVISEAISSRFLVTVEVLTDYNLAAEMGVPKEIIVVAKNLKRKQDAGTILNAPQMRNLLGFKMLVEQFGLEFALSNLVAKAEPSDREEYVSSINSSYSKKIDVLSMQ